METLIYPESKLKISSCDNGNYQVKEKINNPKLGLDLKFYQKIFVLFLTSCVFLIFPESPQDSEVLCKKHHSIDACVVW